jgi:Matrixin
MVRSSRAFRFPPPDKDRPRSNWTSPDAPCARYDDLRKYSLGDIGVKIDAREPWADGFRQALSFWNTVPAANFHEETNLNVCTVRIIDGSPDILKAGIAARAQLTYWNDFRGKIAVSSVAAKYMGSAEIYSTAVHELGHLLGLKHNANIHSVMYFIDLDGTEFLDSKDISDLKRFHELRQAIFSKQFPGIPLYASFHSA